MRVVIVTGTAPHHRYLCAHIAGTSEVVGVIHPIESSRSFSRRLSVLMRSYRRIGMALLLNYVAAKVAYREPRRGNESVGVDGGIDGVDRSLIHPNCDVKNVRTHELLRSLRPDITICLGGPVYPEAFIKASPCMANFHSGVSPIYNGTRSIHFAFANGHPHLCGGTLMLMAPEVDGGRILGHYLPEVSAGDTPELLFSKTVRGAAKLYEAFLKHIESHGFKCQSIPQAAALFYTRGTDYGWYQEARIRHCLRSDLCARYARNESSVEYWSQDSGAAASELFLSTINNLLWRKPQISRL